MRPCGRAVSQPLLIVGAEGIEPSLSASLLDGRSVCRRVAPCLSVFIIVFAPLCPVGRFLCAVAYDFGTSEVGLAVFQILHEWAWLSRYQFKHEKRLPFVRQTFRQLQVVTDEVRVVGQCLGCLP